MRPRTDCDQQIVDQRKRQHFLGSDGDYPGAPAFQRALSIHRQVFAHRLFERKCGIQISAHQAVLGFRRFGEHQVQLVAVCYRLHEGLGYDSDDGFVKTVYTSRL